MFEFPNDIPPNLDKEKLYASGDRSTPSERLRNFLTPSFTYFSILNDPRISKERKDELLAEYPKQCYELLPYIKYWLNKIE